MPSPLPGTQPKPRGLFVDRWGTLLAEPRRSPCNRFEDAEPIDGAVDALFRARSAGWSIYLIGNEEDVAHGRQSDRDWKRFEEGLLDHMKRHGAHVDRNYACLDHPEGKGDHARPSVFCLPNTGFFYHAAQMDHIELEQSWVLGDSTLELVAGARAGCRTAAVRTGLALSDRGYHVEPHLIGADLAEVVAELLADVAVTPPRAAG